MLSWIYPTTCELCHESAELSLCPDCLAGLERVPRPICLYCGAPLKITPATTAGCPFCERQPRPFTLARSALLGNEQNMQLIYKLKYHQAIYLAAALAPLLAEVWHHTPGLNQDFAGACLVPVPTSSEHEQKRGYNQAAELATALGNILGLPIAHVLQRCDTEHGSQTRLSATQRRLNAYRAFQVRPAYSENRRSLPPHIVLVDDVFTTGSTARACCHALLQIPGVQRVAVMTLVRAERK
ncbi:MAG: ComF family protein [Akkermansia sp.]|nr:ComF family protein [Akkermansia sp.]